MTVLMFRFCRVIVVYLYADLNYSRYIINRVNILFNRNCSNRQRDRRANVIEIPHLHAEQFYCMKNSIKLISSSCRHMNKANHYKHLHFARLFFYTATTKNEKFDVTHFVHITPVTCNLLHRMLPCTVYTKDFQVVTT